MLTARPKASSPQADDLTLYAHAQARVGDVKRACDGPCKGCPGPGAPEGCERRGWPRVVAGRADWPVCPLGMLRVPTWQDIVDTKVAARISPLADFPNCLTAGAYRGLVELHDALAREEERAVKAISKSGDGPQFTGRRVARGEG